MRCAILAALAITSIATHAQSPIIGVWQFNETMGTTAADIGPFQNNGTLTNFGASPWVPGQLGNALNFDGIDDYVDIAFNGGLPMYTGSGEAFSITMWVRGSATEDDRVLSLSNSTQTATLLTFGTGRNSLGNQSKFQVFRRHDNNNTRPSRYSNADVFDGTWHHVAYVEHSSYMKIYVDGQLDSSYPIDTGARVLTADIMTLGSIYRPSAGSPICCSYTGDIDDLHIYSYPLSASDVTSVMAGNIATMVRGSYGTFGNPCNGLGSFGGMRLTAAGSPTPGGTLEFRVYGGAANAVPLMLAAPGYAQRTDIEPFGAPAGCTLYADFLNSVTLPLAPLDAFGSSLAGVPITIPNAPALVGVALTFQGLDPNPLAASSAIVALIGN